MNAILPITGRRRASDPKVSAWVDASAGTGKTTVLTDRVLRLLLDGASPDRILCITFTRAAAAEMSNRIIERLGGWAVKDDAALVQELYELTGERPDAAAQTRARTLFAAIVDAPAGFRIQTIHAFCQSVLRRFPLEAGLAPHFDLLDDRTAGELLAEARQAVLFEAGRDPHGPLGKALSVLIEYMDERGFADLIQAVLSSRRRIAQAIADHHGVGLLVPRMWRELGLEPGETPVVILEDACREGLFDRAGLRHACETLAVGSNTDMRRADGIAAWLASEDRVAGWSAYLGQFLSSKGEPNGNYAKTKAHKAMAHILEPEALRLMKVLDRLRCAATAAATEAMLVMADAIFRFYEARKSAKAMLDYDDLIEVTRRLVESDAAWVLYKLDGGIDHLLVDEAQDTNPEQWRIIQALSAEFFAGAGAQEQNRTIFVVGDGKQSIYSFQGADPTALGPMRRYFEQQLENIKAVLQPVDLTKSFRSTDPVLRLVDGVFANPEACDGVHDDPDIPLKHDLSRIDAPGLVELWPVFEPEDEEEVETAGPWAANDKPRTARDPEQDLAARIADTIQGWIAAREPLVPGGAPIGAGDIMILVRRRTRFVMPLIRALKARDVPVAGVDRLALTEPLAVQDLMSLGRFLLLPEDDLTLAALLKSPLIGLSEDQLFTLAYNRSGSLWNALLAASETNAKEFEPARAWLARLLAEVDFARPFELYAGVLAAPCPGDPGSGRKALWRRLGPDALDPLDEFLSAALDYEQRHAPTLEGFIGWLEASDAEIKRELAGRGDSVRIVTVHGAKGLEAPIVFLPDTMQVPSANTGPQLLWHDPGDGRAIPYWSPRAEVRPTLCGNLGAANHGASLREYRRLLYVALTRARDRLYIGGWRGKRSPAAGHWYGLVEAGMRSLNAQEIPEEDGRIRMRIDYAGTGRTLPQPEKKQTQGALPLPEWAGRLPAPEPRPFVPLAPSRIEYPGAAEPAVRSPATPEDSAKFRKGKAIHRLLQLLPDIPAADRGKASKKLLIEFPAERHAALLAEAEAVIDAAEFAGYFGPGSRAEVPIVGRIGLRGVAGRIDRLLVEPERVTIVDFKTGRMPPGGPGDVPANYLAQMAAYRAVLRQIYPDRDIDVVLVWTDGPAAVTLPSVQLDPYEAYLTSTPVNADAPSAA